MKTTRRALLAAVPALAAACAEAQLQTPEAKAPPRGRPAQGEAGPELSFQEIPVLPPEPPSRISGIYAGRQWVLQRYVDADETTALLNDLRFASAGRGIAVGSLTQKEREEPQALVTRDGGQTWTAVKLKDFPLSLAVIDESRAFLVGRDALWYTDEGGVSWTKRKLPKEARKRPMFRAHFVDEKRGWIFGAGKTYYSTQDGGLSWEKVPESAAVNLKDENTVWTWMNFVNAQIAMIVGFSASPPRDVSRFPDWMMPERAARRHLTPSTTVLGESRDGGRTWRIGVTSAFGRVTRLRTLGTRGYAIYHYGDGMEFPSEVYALDLSTGVSKPFFRRRELWAHDVAPLHGGGAIVAAIEPPGRLRSSPIPGRLRLFYTPGGEAWFEMKADYRAAGRRAVLSRVDDTHLWVATDEGSILHLDIPS